MHLLDLCPSSLFPQKMVGEVSRLLKTVKKVESEAARGIQLLEKTIDLIESDLVVRPLHVIYLHYTVYLVIFI